MSAIGTASGSAATVGDRPIVAPWSHAGRGNRKRVACSALQVSGWRIGFRRAGGYEPAMRNSQPETSRNQSATPASRWPLMLETEGWPDYALIDSAAMAASSSAMAATGSSGPRRRRCGRRAFPRPNGTVPTPFHRRQGRGFRRPLALQEADRRDLADGVAAAARGRRRRGPLSRPLHSVPPCRLLPGAGDALGLVRAGAAGGQAAVRRC